MLCIAHRYRFVAATEMSDVEAALLLALWGVESLRGESQVRLDAAYALDTVKRTCVIDACTPVGRDLNRLFVGFLRREYGEDAFAVERVRRAVANELATSAN